MDLHWDTESQPMVTQRPSRHISFILFGRTVAPRSRWVFEALARAPLGGTPEMIAASGRHRHGGAKTPVALTWERLRTPSVPPLAGGLKRLILRGFGVAPPLLFNGRHGVADGR